MSESGEEFDAAYWPDEGTTGEARSQSPASMEVSATPPVVPVPIRGEITDKDRMEWIERECWALGQEIVTTNSFDLDGFPVERDMCFAEDCRRRYYSESSYRVAIDKAIVASLPPTEEA